MSPLQNSTPPTTASESITSLFMVVHARVMARLEVLVTLTRTPEVQRYMSGLATGLAIAGTPNLRGTKLPPEVTQANGWFLGELGLAVPEHQLADFAAEMCAPGH